MKINCSVEILTRNSAHTIARCLESVKNFDDIMVLDGGSTDDTREIAARLGARVTDQEDGQRENQAIGDFAAVRNRGLAVARHPWFMYIDSDEYLSPKGVEEIRGIVESPAPEAHVWWQPRKYVLNDVVIECATTYPNRQIRLFHRDFVQGFVKPIHERILVNPGVKTAVLRHCEYVPLGSPASLKARWERYRNMEIAIAAGMRRPKSIRVVLGELALFVFYALRYVRNIFFCRGARLPFSYEWLRHCMIFGFIWRLLKQNFRTAPPASRRI
ncbi:MAG: glycosyltransferase family 2 protein [Patescibacteria group bacterium]